MLITDISNLKFQFQQLMATFDITKFSRLRGFQKKLQICLLSSRTTPSDRKPLSHVRILIYRTKPISANFSIAALLECLIQISCLSMTLSRTNDTTFTGGLDLSVSVKPNLFNSSH